MTFKGNILASLVVIVLGAVLFAAGQEQSKGLVNSGTPAIGGDAAAGAKPIHAPSLQSAADRRVEGEKRFHANCSRCHMAPHKFPPRMMATIERHMRVRALVTAEDMQFILGYMTE